MAQELEFDSVINKLILLYFVEKMDFAMTENSILDIATSRNTWLTYMECKECMWQLEDVKFIGRKTMDNGEERYYITYQGRSCLSHYFQRIPIDMRSQITQYAKDNARTFKRNQDYRADYIRNPDNSYTIVLRIIDPSMEAISTRLEIKMYSPSRVQAIEACKMWRTQAPEIYEYLIEKFE